MTTQIGGPSLMMVHQRLGTPIVGEFHYEQLSDLSDSAILAHDTNIYISMVRHSVGVGLFVRRGNLPVQLRNQYLPIVEYRAGIVRD